MGALSAQSDAQHKDAPSSAQRFYCCALPDAITASRLVALFACAHVQQLLVGLLALQFECGKRRACGDGRFNNGMVAQIRQTSRDKVVKRTSEPLEALKRAPLELGSLLVDWPAAEIVARANHVISPVFSRSLFLTGCRHNSQLSTLPRYGQRACQQL